MTFLPLKIVSQWKPVLIRLALNLMLHNRTLNLLGIETSRLSADNVVNNDGCKLIEMCKGIDLMIENGRFGNDKEKRESRA